MLAQFVLSTCNVPVFLEKGLLSITPGLEVQFDFHFISFHLMWFRIKRARELCSRHVSACFLQILLYHPPKRESESTIFSRCISWSLPPTPAKIVPVCLSSALFDPPTSLSQSTCCFPLLVTLPFSLSPSQGLSCACPFGTPLFLCTTPYLQNHDVFASDLM